MIECSATDLAGEYLGHNGPNILETFDRAVGKVLFIDEAYRLVKRDRFSKEAATDIVGAMSNPRFEQKIHHSSWVWPANGYITGLEPRATKLIQTPHDV